MVELKTAHKDALEQALAIGLSEQMHGITDLGAKNINPTSVSGRQELLENIVNRYV